MTEGSPFDRPVIGQALRAMATVEPGHGQLPGEEPRKRGRPALSHEVTELVLELRRTGMGYTSIADKLGIGRTTVRRILGATLRETGRENGGLYSGEAQEGPGGPV
jgi:DNA invertase Pin-like site-specific DNA recombinase